MKKSIPPFNEATLQSVSKVIGNAFSNSEIYDLLVASNIPDIAVGITKWRRVFSALADKQNKTHDAIHIIGFLRRGIAPERFVGRRDEHLALVQALNSVLVFAGLEATDEGRIRTVSRATTLADAEKRANELRYHLETRGVHEEILKFCRTELVEKNYFHAVFEATKSVADRIRTISGSSKDGGQLATEALSLGKSRTPLVRINALSSESELSEQKGFCNLVEGFFGMFRNTTAHSPKIYWEINQSDALDIMTIASLIHRKLDNSESQS